MSSHIHLIGFGSQGTAWAENLRASGWHVSIYLARKDSESFARALENGFSPNLTSDLRTALSTDASEVATIAMLLPDDRIASAYDEHIKQSTRPLTLILAHGYSVYAGELKDLRANHEASLLAPKAIGPKLRAAFQAAFPTPHSLVAAFFASPARECQVRAVAAGLGFARENLQPATFEQEAIGDLISEQTLLCGGVFNLLEWTAEAMERAGVPEKLIREECLTELELIAGLIRERGPATTLSKISQAALCGTISMRERLLRAGVDTLVAEQAQAVVDKRFVKYLREEKWKAGAAELRAKLQRWEEKKREHQP